MLNSSLSSLYFKNPVYLFLFCRIFVYLRQEVINDYMTLPSQSNQLHFAQFHLLNSLTSFLSQTNNPMQLQLPELKIDGRSVLLTRLLLLLSRHSVSLRHTITHRHSISHRLLLLLLRLLLLLSRLSLRRLLLSGHTIALRHTISLRHTITHRHSITLGHAISHLHSITHLLLLAGHSRRLSSHSRGLSCHCRRLGGHSRLTSHSRRLSRLSCHSRRLSRLLGHRRLSIEVHDAAHIHHRICLLRLSRRCRNSIHHLSHRRHGLFSLFGIKVLLFLLLHRLLSTLLDGSLLSRSLLGRSLLSGLLSLLLRLKIIRIHFNLLLLLLLCGRAN